MDKTLFASRTKLATILFSGLFFSSVQAATFTAIPQPDAAYVADTTLIDISGIADGTTPINSITDGTQTVSFTNGGLTKRSVPGSWSTWSSPPDSETATPHILHSIELGQTLDLSAPAVIFGFELEPNPLSVQPFNADFILMSGPTIVGSIPINVDGASGARLFAAEVTGQVIDRVVVAGTSEFAIANVRYQSPSKWFTGGGTIKDGKKPKWTIGGNAGDDITYGQSVNLHLTNHATKTKYRLDTISSITFDGVATQSPPSRYNRVVIVATGTDSTGAAIPETTVTIVDNDESGKGADTIEMTGGITLAETELSGGNFQIHME